MAKILLIDDDKQLVEAVKKFLESCGHVLDTCFTGGDGLQFLLVSPYDLILLDWHLPDIEGPEICRQFRHKGGKTPIIYLTGKDDTESLIFALDNGGDDYMKKPFQLGELRARISANLRRKDNEYIEAVSWGGVTLDPVKHLLIPSDDSYPTISLRGKEYTLLECLMKNPNKYYTAQELLDKCWPAGAEVGANSVRTWMGLIRQKLAQIGKADFVKTVAGRGYVVEKD